MGKPSAVADTMSLQVQIPPPPNSFRAEYTARPPGFRTPPPPSDSFEPLSPTRVSRYNGPPSTVESRKRKLDDAHAHYRQSQTPSSRGSRRANGKSRGVQSLDYTQTEPSSSTSQYPSQVSPTPLDVIATVATSPSLSQTTFSPPSITQAQWPRTSPSSGRGGTGRPAKRSRSEVINARQLVHPTSRPLTSHPSESRWSNQSGAHLGQPQTLNGIGPSREYGTSLPASTTIPTDNSVEEAELLLSFARGAQFHNPRPPHIHEQPNTSFANAHATHYDTQTRKEEGSRWLALADQYNSTDSTSTHAQQPQEPQSTAPYGDGHHLHVYGEIQRPQREAPAEVVQDQIAATVPRTIPTISEPQLETQKTKPRVHKGWPKGKPRGSRNSGTSAKGGRRSSNKKAGSNSSDSQNTRSDSKTAREKRAAEIATSSRVLPSPDVPPRPKSSGASRPSSDVEPSAPNRQIRHSSVPRDVLMRSPSELDLEVSGLSATVPKRAQSQTSLCAACKSKHTPNGFQDLWITCNGCKSWFHTPCVGFKSEREVRDVDKFHCPDCEPTHGKTTFVRKSSRAHASVDYAGLNEGQIRTSTDTPEHHYIQPFKDGTIQFQPESFPRMPPELVTASFFEKSGTMSEPVLIPAYLNPQPDVLGADSTPSGSGQDQSDVGLELFDWFYEDIEYDCVPDDGQDRLDMVMPKDLTVRRVAELYGPEERVEVIDVKSQEGGDNRWNMNKWADYYEAVGEKPVRNVISLEVSQSKLGRLIRRPKIVRDLDLQDAVWPTDELAKGQYPQVQFYCLMSVADCYTDFHIDFGGSSVYYHILKGKKTFFFIPPKKQHLKKYEEWCLSANQGSTFLGNITKECYRVDLSEGDTMLIPSGWIHAVWTPENSLVIGGNFLTRMHYSMQIQVNEIEKNTGVGRRFRYPSFQKVLWFAVIQYLQEDPVPSTVAQLLYDGGKFERPNPVYLERDEIDSENRDPEFYNARYYSQGEIEGLADLLRFVSRTVMISLGKIPGIAKTTQEAVIRSLPKGYGDHLDILKTFALWAAWKRGNEELPHWAHPDTPASEIEAAPVEKKISTATVKKMDREAARQPAIPERRSQRQIPKEKEPTAPSDADKQNEDEEVGKDSTQALSNANTGARRLACEACRQRRIRCKHKTIDESSSAVQRFGVKLVGEAPEYSAPAFPPASPPPDGNESFLTASPSSPSVPKDASIAVVINKKPEPQSPVTAHMDGNSPGISSQPRIKACEECRKSKRRCIHDANGNVDPVKALQAPVPRAFSASKRSRTDGDTNGFAQSKRIKTDDGEDAGSFFEMRTEGVEQSAEQTMNSSPSGTTHVMPEPGGQLHALLDDIADPPAIQDMEGIQSRQEASSLEPLNDGERGNYALEEDVVLSSAPKNMISTDKDISRSVEDNPTLNPTNDVSSLADDQNTHVAEASVKTEASPSLREDDRPGTSVSAENQVSGIANRLSSENRSRTPSAHVQTNSTESAIASASPPTSPLTELETASPTIRGKKARNNSNSRKNKTPRSARQVSKLRNRGDQVTSNQVDPETPKGTSKTSDHHTSGSVRSNYRASSSKKRTDSSSSASRSGTLGLNGVTEHKLSPLKGTSKRTLSGTEEDDDDDDENMKLARELQEQEFGLRRRGK